MCLTPLAASRIAFRAGCWLVCLVLAAPCGIRAESPDWLDPTGIGGELLLSPLPPNEDFARIVHRKLPRQGGNVLVLAPTGTESGLWQPIVDQWNQNPRGELRIMVLEADAPVETHTAAVERSDAVWFLGFSPSAEPAGRRLPPSLATASRRRLRAGATFAVCGEAFSLAGAGELEANSPPTWNFLPGLRILGGEAEQADEPRQRGSEVVACEIPENTALVVTDRVMQIAGPGSITLRWPKTVHHEAKSLRLFAERRFADLTAVRRIARERLLPPFPPAEPAPPRVERGALVIVGGGGMPRGLLERFVELAGGAESSIVVLPTAVPTADGEGDSMRQAFLRAGAKQVTVLPQRTREEVESPECLAAFRDATGIWFGGGRQWRFVDAYLDTAALPLMHEVLRRGGVIGGSSAGASIQGEFMARGDPLGNLKIMAEGYERGLGFLPGAAIDQHFTQRGRHGDMEELVTRHPQLLGIGVDETTALVVRGAEGEVVGRGDVYFFDGRRMNDAGGPTVQALGNGRRFNLVERRPIPVDRPPTP